MLTLHVRAIKFDNGGEATLLTLGGGHVHQLLHAVRALQLDVVLLLMPDLGDASQQSLEAWAAVCILGGEVGSSQEGLEVRCEEA